MKKLVLLMLLGVTSAFADLKYDRLTNKYYCVNAVFPVITQDRYNDLVQYIIKQYPYIQTPDDFIKNVCWNYPQIANLLSMEEIPEAKQLIHDLQDIVRSRRMHEFIHAFGR